MVRLFSAFVNPPSERRKPAFDSCDITMNGLDNVKISTELGVGDVKKGAKLGVGDVKTSTRPDA